MKDGFHLEELKITNREKIIFDVKFLDQDQELNNQLFTTVIIGANGAGKSYLLALIVEIFRAIENRKNNKELSLRYDSYYLKYYFGKQCYTVEIYKKKFKLMKNQEIVNINQVAMPLKVLAVSFMINDKFIFKADNKDSQDIYEYLGTRRTSNATWTNSIVRKVSEALIENVEKPGFYKKVKEILEFLKFKPKITIVFEPDRKTLFTRKMSLQVLEGKINKIKHSREYRAFSINKYQQEDILDLYKFINETSKDRLKANVNNKVGIEYTIDLERVESNKPLFLDNDPLQKLMDLKLLNSPMLKLHKDDEFDFEFASSGEKQFLYTMINIASKLEQNSLVLIDEPELSFHPNWQMTYINYLKKIFRDYPTCHFLLATHSHYIVSDLQPSSSSLVILDTINEEKNVRKAELVTYSTYAWSAENILYNIFQVRTTRNYYFEMDLRRLVGAVKNKTQNIDELSSLINKLKGFVFDELDPINIIIQDAERYLSHVRKVE
ncbi:AAA family ATPase [Priestia megaterium]|uniref:AAA family ATPase n=1 Tax=Priestia megaterium TaxID=1404 RepID=UPI001AE0B2F9|nr:AAA family ATPase [Priestia megaterium]